MQELEHEIKQLIIASLSLEDIAPDDIETEAPLFVDGLGLDSIDALELGLALQKRYSDPVNYECHSGALMSGITLKGRFAKVAE